MSSVKARVAQLDRALVSGTKGRGFESLRAFHVYYMVNGGLVL